MAVGTCSECGKQKELKDRTVCAACRKRLQRRKQTAVGASVSASKIKATAATDVSGQLAVSEPGQSPEQQPTTKNPDQWYIGYYENNTGQKVVLDKDTYDQKCYVCKQPFKTRLELQKFCSLECRQFFLTGGKV